MQRIYKYGLGIDGTIITIEDKIEKFLHIENQDGWPMVWALINDDVEKGNLSNTDELPPTFDAYLKSAMPYVVTYLIVKYFTVYRDPYLLEIEMFKLLRDNLSFSKQRFQRLNIYLNQLEL